MQNREREFKFTLKDFDYLRNITNKKTGIVVSDDKFDMFYARLSKHVRRLGLSDFRDYCQVISRGESQEMVTLINSVTTNLTSFFREKHHFDYMKADFIPRHVKNRQDRKLLRIWSAGCSTGEEPYSIAMQTLESLPLGWQVKITATDVDTDVLAKARTGVYPVSKLDGISDSRLKQWFYKGAESKEGYVKVRKELTDVIEFKQLNLIENWFFQDKFDLIFCRNVLIYFDIDTKKKIADKFYNVTRDGGCLMIGHSESLFNVSSKFKLIGNTIYEKL